MEDATATHQAFAIFLSHDVSLLRLFETFLESAPQLILVIYIILHTNQAEIFQGECQLGGASFGEMWASAGINVCYLQYPFYL